MSVRKFRVSVFPAGAADLGASPVKHHACSALRTAEDHFLRYVLQKGMPRVIVHQGNLRGHAYKTHIDSTWGEHFSNPRRQWEQFIENKRVDRGES